jgi:membrane protein YqaA with SNARE-associated domain
MEYITLFIMVFLVNVVPEFAPPTWTVMSPFIFLPEIDVFYVILITITGATMGRFILLFYIEKIGNNIFNKWQKDNLNYIGSKIGRTDMQNLLFVFLYSLTPLSTGALFIVAGLAKLKKTVTLIGFFFGRLISYSVIAYSVKYGIDLIGASRKISMSEFMITSMITVSALLFLIFIDWKTLIEEKKFHFNFKIWRWNK